MTETDGLIALARLVLARDTERDGCRDRATKVETVSETPIATTGSIVASEDKARAGVSLSRVPGGETPETPQESPPIGPQWGEAGHEGSVPRAWAEGFARLDPDRRPATCRRGAGCGSSTTLAGFSIAVLRCRRSTRLGTARPVRVRSGAAFRSHRSGRAFVALERRSPARADRKHGDDRDQDRRAADLSP